MLIKTSTRILH